MINNKRRTLSSKLEEIKQQKVDSDDKYWLDSLLFGCGFEIADLEVNMDIQQIMMNIIVDSEDVISEIRIDGLEIEATFVDWVFQNLCISSEVFVAFELPSFRYCDWIKVETNYFRRMIINLLNKNESLKFLVKQGNDSIFCFTDTETSVQLVKPK